MKSLSLKKKILDEFERLIAMSCANLNGISEFNDLHTAILKKAYNAAEVAIDYSRNRIDMDIVMDDTVYDQKAVNLHLPTFRANMTFKNLGEFLKTCLTTDHASLAFYASLLQARQRKKADLTLA
ncbi:hypothetical protein [Spongiimicrobium salis]|uniref:hypothetical protein n=1 Tax=Spongiimicrobium salis TaxID=1667022 RepID=UPI00374D142B